MQITFRIRSYEATCASEINELQHPQDPWAVRVSDHLFSMLTVTEAFAPFLGCLHPIDIRMSESQQISDQQNQSKWPSALRALRHRNYQLFFSGQLISLIGTWMDQV